MVAPFNGVDPTAAQRLLSGTRLAVRDQNAAGGVEGYGVQLAVADDEMDPAIAERRAREFVLDPQIVAVAGCLTAGTASTVRPIFKQAELPFLSFAPGEPGDPEFRLLPTETELVKRVGDELDRLGTRRRVAIVSVDMPSFRRLGDASAGELLQRGWSVVAQAHPSDRMLRFADIVEGFAAVQPDVVLFAGLPDQGTFLAEEVARALPSAWVLDIATADAPEWERQGAAGRALVMRRGWQAASADGQALARRLQETAGEPATSLAALGYDTVRLLLDAAASQPTRNGVASALRRRADSTGRLTLGPAWPVDRLIRVELVRAGAS